MRSLANPSVVYRMRILALEFSSIQRSVALIEGSSNGVLVQEVIETGQQSNQAFAMIEDVLKQAAVEREQVEALAIGLGPGSYTGIRGAIALAQGWQLAAGTPVQGISSAECIAAQAQADGLPGPVAVVIDAQRNEFYLANYELSRSGWQELEPLRLTSRAAVTERENSGDLIVGPEVFKWFPNSRTLFPRASMLGKLALARSRFTPAESLQPIYLRATSFVKAPPPRLLPE